MEENLKLRKVNENKESQLLILKAELDSTIQRIEKLEVINFCLHFECSNSHNGGYQCYTGIIQWYF